MFENCKEKKYYWVILPAISAILGIFLVVLTVAKIVDIKDKIKTTGNTISVSGTGDVFTKPDLVLATFSVVTEAKTVAEALSQNSEKMNDVTNFVKSQGIEEKDLKTVNFNISPRYEWRNEGTKRVLVGYEVQQSLQVKIRALEKIGAIIEGTIVAGVNQAGDLQFTIDKEDELKSQAREEAIKQAKEKAEELAGQLGIKLVKIINFSENSIVPMPYYGLEKLTAPAGLGGQAPQIETGENKIEVTVNIIYEIR